MNDRFLLSVSSPNAARGKAESNRLSNGAPILGASICDLLPVGRAVIRRLAMSAPKALPRKEKNEMQEEQ